MSEAGSLPEDFAELEGFANDWALDSEAARNAKRLESSFEELRRFYDAALGHLDAIGAHLGGFDLDALPDPERRLYHLALSLMEVAPAVEIHGAPDVADAIEAERFVIRSP